MARHGWTAERLIARGMPLPMALLALIVALGPQAGWMLWAAFCVSSSFGALAQPAVGMALPPQAAGRALSAYNLVIFAGVFCIQWAIGLAIDALALLGWDDAMRLRGAMLLFLLACGGAYAAFWSAHRRHGRGGRG